MGFLGNFSPLLTQAANARSGYNTGVQQGQDKALKESLAALAQKRQVEQDALKASLTQSEIGKNNYRAPVRDPVADHEANRVFDAAHPTTPAPLESLLPVMQGGKRIYTPRSKAAGLEAPAPEPADPLVQTADDQGVVSYTPRSQAAGMHPPAKAGTAGNLPAPMAAKVGQFGEMLKKTSDLLPATEALEVSLGNSAANDVATKGIGIAGHALPGTRGLGSMMASKSPEFATYQASLTPFVLAAAHALSGARINDEQVKQIRASIEITPGMQPQERAQKKKNLIDLVNSIGGSLPPDAIAGQEGQMDENALALLEGRGYKRSVKASSGGGRAGGGGTKTPQSEGAWAAKNPPHAGEAFEAYHARYLQSQGTP